MGTKSYENEAIELLKGSIDTHIHSSPDVVPRKLDDLAVAREAAKAGMRAIMLTCHVAPTEGRAYLVQQVVTEVKVFGGIVLNSNVGGLNPVAVQISLKMGAKNVWMPTVSSANHINFLASSDHLKAVGGGIKEQGMTIYDGKGKLKPEIVEIIMMVKEADIILSTGNISAKESLLLIDEALRQGLKKILYSHPDGHMTYLPLEEQKKLAARGVFFERCWSVTTEVSTGKHYVQSKDMANVIKEVGPESTVMASDFGMIKNPPPVEGLKEYIAEMLNYGVTPKEIELMTKYNPAQLLGI